MKFLFNTLLPALLFSPNGSAETQHGSLRSHLHAQQQQQQQQQQQYDRTLQECTGSEPSTCGCDSVNQADYRGNISVTASGNTCQSWSAQSPQGHDRTPQNYPDKGLENNNSCRNPDDESDGAWCYTMDPDSRWEFCNVPSCTPPPPGTPAPTIPTPATSSPISSPATSAPTTDLPVCATPELTDLETLTSDLRTAYQNANLPTITDAGAGAGSGTSTATTIASSSCQTPLAKQKILMIGIDGLRADVVGMIPLPAIRRLQSMGTYSFWADVQSSASAISGPGWTSMFTGVQPSKHLVDGNGDLNDINVAYPTVFKLVKDTFGLKIAASVSWSPLVTDLIDHEDDTTLDARYLASNDDAMASKAEEWITSEAYDFVFVDFDGPDAAGHSTGFDGYDAIYQERVRYTDVLIGKLLDAALSTSDGEEWLIVLTSDHGGEGTGHGASDAYNRKIPFMVASNSPRVNVGYMPSFEDPGSQMDVLPTIMHFLGGPDAVPSGLDGQVFGFKDYARVPPPPPSGTCIPDPSNCGCASSKQADYRGTISVTASGKTCQAWDSQYPHSHTRTSEDYPSSGLESNYCRNPDGEPKAWCYTTNLESRFELCDVPTCNTTT